jgi:NADP-dependent 3-hydroxy acid dehydrogenase YdfG
VRTVLITGASSGFGATAARRFAARGHRVIAAARRTDRLHDLAKELGPDILLPLTLDVRDRASVHQFSLNLRSDLHGTGVRVTCVEPGLVSGTEFSQVRFGADSERAAAVYAGTQPLTPDDIAAAIEWATSHPPALPHPARPARSPRTICVVDLCFVVVYRYRGTCDRP